MEQRSPRLVDPLRVFLWIGVFAFFAGFTGYLAVSLGEPSSAPAFAAAPAAEYAPARLSPPDDPWVFEKAI